MNWSRRSRDHMRVGFTITITYASSAYHHWCCDFRARCTTLCGKVGQWLATGRWFSPGTPVSSTNKTDGRDITEILLKVALSTMRPSKQTYWTSCNKTTIDFYNSFSDLLKKCKLLNFQIRFRNHYKIYKPLISIHCTTSCSSN